jgi:hypothetical protein
MARTGYMARIGETSAPNGACKAMRVEDAGMDANGKPGKGCASVILFNPKFVPAGSKAEVVLCKQLVHALMNALGKRATGLIRGERAADLQALGVAPYPRRAPTENSLRKELGLPERTGT